MKIIVGLGNIGKEYAKTRHNIGFMVADELARRWGLSDRDWKEKFDAQAAELRYSVAAGGKGVNIGLGPEKLLLLKPTTYMNNSGLAVGQAARFYQVAPQDVAVVQDDMDMQLGQTRVRDKGSSGGHNGLKSIAQHLGSQAFWHFKVGIGHPAHNQQAVLSHVLHPFYGEDLEKVEAAVTRMADALELWLAGDLSAMQRMGNYKPPKPVGEHPELANVVTGDKEDVKVTTIKL